MNLSAPFINRPVMTTFVMLAILIGGWLSFMKLPVSDLPTVERPEIEVKAGYVGANPDTILHLVTIPLEKELGNIKGVQEMLSTSSSGRSAISLKFDLSKNMDEAVRDVQAAINRAEGEMPRDMTTKPYYSRQQGSQEPIMYMLMMSDSVSLADLRAYADASIIPRLSRIEGVAQVTAFGESRSIWVRINPELMAARGIGFDLVIDSINQHTSKIPMGSIQTGSKTLSIELGGQVKDISQLENIEIGKTRVRLKDIAEVSEKSSEKVDYHYVSDGKRALTMILSLQKISDANTVAVSQEVRKAIEEIKIEMPPTINFKLWFDKAIWIHESILDVEWTLLFAFILVVLVIYISLGRLSEAIIPSVALPLSLVGTCIAMYAFDFSLDLLSLLALTLSVGFVVDDAIVVLENIVRHQELGESPREASLNGSKQICFTILSMTLSLVAVFIPLLFMQGMTGRLFREFSMTLAVSILVSGFISLTLTPLMCSRFLPKLKKHTWMQKKVTHANDRLVRLYGKTLKWCFNYSKTTLMIAGLFVAAAVPLFMKLPVKLVPDEDRGFFFSFIRLPSGIDKSEIKDYQYKLGAIFQENKHIDSMLDIYAGGSLIFVVQLKALAEREPQDKIIEEIQAKLETIPGIIPFTKGYNLINLDLEFGSGGQHEFIVKGQEFEDVEKAAHELARELQSNPLFSFVQPPQKNDMPQLVVHINEDLSRKMGLTKKQIQNLLQTAFGRNEVAKLRKGTTEDRVYLELLKDYQNSPDALSKIYLSPASGELVPLKTLVHWEETLGSPNLVQREQYPSVSIRFSLKEGASSQEGLSAVEDAAKKILPLGVSGNFSLSTQAMNQTINHTLLLLLAASIVMYMVLGILYESFIHPLTILSSLPFAGLGGVLTLFLFDEPLSIFSAVGFLLLIGIVKKNGIMMIDYALENQKNGMNAAEAIYEGCLVRFRPIMMTTVAAIMGALPIAIGFGDGAEIRQGLGLVIVGGLLFSQVLTLYATPIIYLTFEKMRKKKIEPLDLDPQREHKACIAFKA